MFQYAIGRALSIASNSKFLIDISRFDGYELHNGFEISRVFDAPVQVATRADLKSLLGWRRHRLILSILKRMPLQWQRGGSLLIEPYFGYWSGVEDKIPPFYIVGYWQSEKYFKSVREVVRKDFRFKSKLDEKNAEISFRIRNCQSVAVHVRRGDYISDPRNARIMATGDASYFQRAISLITKHISEPQFFVFSDDIEWVRREIKFPYRHQFVDWNKGTRSYIDMQLISQCKHQIISNSTFSWWGAWLNNNREKIVIGPKKWFVNKLDDRDLVPADWIRI